MSYSSWIHYCNSSLYMHTARARIQTHTHTQAHPFLFHVALSALALWAAAQEWSVPNGWCYWSREQHKRSWGRSNLALYDKITLLSESRLVYLPCTHKLLSLDNHLHTQLHFIACLPCCNDICSLHLFDIGHFKALSLKVIPLTKQCMFYLWTRM